MRRKEDVKLAERWAACSEAARRHASLNCKPGVLPHVIAEAFDAGRSFEKNQPRERFVEKGISL